MTERIAKLEQTVDRVEEKQDCQEEKLDEILAGIHRLNGFEQFKEEHDKMWRDYDRKNWGQTVAVETAKIVSGGGVLALILQVML